MSESPDSAFLNCAMRTAALPRSLPRLYTSRNTSEAQDNGLLDPTLATGIGRVKGIKRAGVRVGNWLTKQQAEQLLHAPDTTTLKGQRESRLACLARAACVAPRSRT